MNTEPAHRLDGDEIEDQIIDELLDRALGRGWGVHVFDGEEFVVHRSHDKAVIRGAMKSTDHDTLYFQGIDGVTHGWVTLIYGNDADLISDASAGRSMTALCDQVHAKFEAHHG